MLVNAVSIDNCFVLLPPAFFAVTVNVDFSHFVGVPEIALPVRVNPSGNVPLSRLHVMGVSPVAANVWLYAVPGSPSGNDAVVIFGATGSGSFLQAVIAKPIISAMLIIPNALIVFFI